MLNLILVIAICQSHVKCGHSQPFLIINFYISEAKSQEKYKYYKVQANPIAFLKPLEKLRLLLF